jgi:hypothetical protein
MSSQSVLATDTNIWIDLNNGGILADVFKLPYQFWLPDLAIPELIRPRGTCLDSVLSQVTSRKHEFRQLDFDVFETLNQEIKIMAEGKLTSMLQ